METPHKSNEPRNFEEVVIVEEDDDVVVWVDVLEDGVVERQGRTPEPVLHVDRKTDPLRTQTIRNEQPWVPPTEIQVRVHLEALCRVKIKLPVCP